jgi:hypothetical protein
MRSHYAYRGQTRTNVIYAGVSRDGKIQAELSTQLGRTDDMVRAYYHLEYTFLEDVNYDRLALFQVAADRYSDNGFTRYAYGDESGVTFDETIIDHVTTGYVSSADRGIELSGDTPWVMLYANARTTDSLPEHKANIGFVVRDYHAVIGEEVITTPHINIVRTYNGGWSQMGFELGLPYEGGTGFIPAGSVVTATVEYLVPPADKTAYFGSSDYLMDMDAEDYQSTNMMRLLAAENQLDVVTTLGTLRRSHPVELDSSTGTTAAQFTITGGLGYTPVTIHGLARPDGWQLEEVVDGEWEQVAQDVEGNDHWQAYDDPASESFSLIFNVHNRDTEEYRLVRYEE